MRIKSFLIALAVFMSGAALFAQEQPADKPVKVGGQIFMFYGYEFRNPDTANKNKEKSEGFTVDRVRVNASKEFESIFKANVTLEGNNSTATNSGDPSVFVRLANLEANLPAGEDVKVKLTAGVFTNPIHDTLDATSGLRWLGKNFYDNASALNQSKVSDYSFGGGAMISIDAMKMVKVTGSIMNGGKTTAAGETFENSGKAIHGVVSITPLGKLLTINGYIASYDVALKNSTLNLTGDNQFTVGGTAALNFENIILGATYLKTTRETDSPSAGKTTAGDSTIVEAFLNANLKEAAGVPVLVIGRYGYGKDKKVANSDTTFYAVGLGYQFNANVQLAAYFENYTYNKNLATFGEGKKQTLYVKSEAKF